MGKYSKKGNNRRVAHTIQDQRYNRKNHLKMKACPSCSSKSLKECSKNGYVWASCTDCGMSGEEYSREDNHLVEWNDVYSTIVDAVYEE